MYAAVSADGYAARPDGEVGPLFDWYGNGEVAWEWNGAEMRTTQFPRRVPRSGRG
ncbi:hypothetical protein [Streptomyces albicerus]|uniref:hypothetical protein n=1 Tax=Streptomyces albicerus TaxID=2569859 RepID=UPI001788D276|nr:hypothetical protein [Streptomyces albicerus]